MREKLIELQEEAEGLVNNDVPSLEQKADHLIASGVTIQKWISVKDRLPEPGEYVLVCDTREDWYGLWEFSGVAWYDDSYKSWSNDEVTHWQYLPQPPKGE